MSNDTQVKQDDKVPERVWLTVFEDDQDPQSTMLEWRSPVVRNTQPGDYVATRPHHKIAYVPESLLAIVCREAFKEARRKVYMISGSTNVDPAVRKGFAAGVNTAIEVIAALEASASEKGDDAKA